MGDDGPGPGNPSPDDGRGGNAEQGATLEGRGYPADRVDGKPAGEENRGP